MIDMDIDRQRQTCAIQNIIVFFLWVSIWTLSCRKTLQTHFKHVDQQPVVQLSADASLQDDANVGYVRVCVWESVCPKSCSF